MKYVYYIKFMVYFFCIFLTKNTEFRIGLAGLAILMLFFAMGLSIEDYIDKKFAENKK